MAAEWERCFLAGELVLCAPAMIEILYLARNGNEYDLLDEELRGAYDHVSCDALTWSLALTAQRRLASVEPSFHRRPPIDLLLAAAAHQHELAVLHYDADYDLIRAQAGLEFESRWLAPRGSI